MCREERMITKTCAILGTVAAAAWLAAGLPATSPGRAATPEVAVPPGWSSRLQWIQPAEFRSAALRGRPTVVEFWTFGCINCRRTIPAMRALDERFGREFAIVGVHTPE